jgi:colanic acid/amylovoran biosynthesis glycosyltransferase
MTSTAGHQSEDARFADAVPGFSNVLKVTFCVHDKPDSVGGPVTWIQRLLPELRRRGIDARCLFLLHWGDSGPGLTALRAQGFDCRAALCHDRTEDRVHWILERLRENPPDVFVPNLVVAGYFAGRWARAAGIPTVGVLHSDHAFYQALQSEFVFGPEPFRVSGIVCVSRALEQEVLARKPARTILRRIPCGVPIPSKRVQRPHSGFRVAFVGRLADEAKRISDVTRAFCRVVKEIPGTEAVIYGDGPERRAVEEILATDGAGLPVWLGGVVTSDRVQERLLDCQVIVLLSDYEGLPIALMEAMACGCVPVCLRVRSGIPELVEDNVTGLLVNDRGDDFVKAIRRLRDDPILWERLSRAARSFINPRFSNDACAEEWAELLHAVQGQASPRRRIRIPKRLRLPAPHPALESARDREPSPSMPLLLYRRGRILGGRIKRKLLRQSLP